MKTQNLTFSISKKSDFKQSVDAFLKDQRYSGLLVQLFIGTDDPAEMQQSIAFINQSLPEDAVIIGCTTAGEILEGHMLEQSILVSISLFENTRLNSGYLLDNNDPMALGRDIANQLIQTDTKALIVFADGLTINGESLINGISSSQQHPPLLAGGMAGDNNHFTQTHLVHKETLFHNGVVAVALNSDTLRAFNTYNLNWQSLGPKLTITRSEAGRVYEINHFPIIDVYRHYLGDGVVENMPDSTVEFPLIIQNYDIPIARSMIAVYDDGSIQFAGNIDKGETVRFGIANVQAISKNKYCMRDDFAHQGAEASFIYSCTARKSFLGNRLEEEFLPLNEIAPVAGFFTYGEIYHLNKHKPNDGQNGLLNITTTVLGLSESEPPQAVPILDHPLPQNVRRQNRSNEALINLVHVTTSELNKELDKRSKDLKMLNQYEQAINKTFIVSKTDLYGNITFANENFEAISGYSLGELLGKNHNIIRHPQTPKHLFKELWSTIQSQQIWSGTLTNRAKDGSDYIVKTTIIPIVDIKGNTSEYLGLREDITQQEIHKKLIQQEQAKTKSILDNQKSLVLLTDISSQKIVEANKSLLEFLGYDSLDELTRKHQCICELFIAKEGYIQANIEGLNWFDYILEHPHTDHKVLINSTSGQPHIFAVYISTVSDNASYLISNFVDISALEQERQRALTAERVQSQFLANMSHELRTPINGILGFANLLKESPLNPKQQRYLEILADSSQHLLSVVNDILDISKIQSGDTQLNLEQESIHTDLHSTLNLFVPIADNKNIELNINLSPKLPECLIYDSLRLRQVLTNLLSNAMKFTPEKGRVFIDITPLESMNGRLQVQFSVKDTGIGIAKDKQSLIFESFKQASTSTSREYGGTGLGLSIASQLVTLMGGDGISLHSEENKGSDFHFVLPMMICQTKTPLSDAFKNLNTCVFNDNEHDNTAILNYLDAFGIAYKTTQHCTTNCATKQCIYDVIFICSTNVFRESQCDYNDKTLFIFFTPAPSDLAKEDNVFELLNFSHNNSDLYNILIDYLIKHSNQPLIAASSSEQATTFNGKVLLAEDNAVNQVLMTAIFKKLGVDFDLANNGQEAVDLYQAGHYDLVFMDINMPIMDGNEAIQIIQTYERENQLPPCPIIALTANVMSDQINNYKANGFYDHLAKPLEVDQLKQLLQQLNKATAPFTQSNTPPFNLKAAAKLIGLPEEVYSKLLEKLITLIEAELPKLTQAINNAKHAQTLELCHHLYGSLSNLRVESLSKLLKQIEESAERGAPTSEIKQQLVQFEIEYKQLKDSIH